MWIKLILLIAAIVLIPLALFVSFHVLQGISSPCIAKFPSPSNPKDQAWLLEEGFQDRGISLYAKTAHAKPVFVAQLDWAEGHKFSYLQWTKDGQMVVATVNPSDRGLKVYAYDYSTRSILRPSWVSESSCEDRPQRDWISYQSNILKAVETHNGLDTSSIDRVSFQQKARSIPEFMRPRR
jgi:hypothetical protein